MTRPDINLAWASRFVRVLHGDKSFWLQTFDYSNRNRKWLTTLKYGHIEELLPDCDTPNTPWPELGPKPHIVIESSPGKFHLYWLIQGCPLSEFRPIQKCIARMYRSDPTVSDLARVMRWPGFLHQKDKPHLTRIVEWNFDD